MKHQNRFSGEQQEQQTQYVGQNQAQAAREFGSVEEMLRHDAVHTPVPPAIAKRLKESLGPVSPSRNPWWKRIFGS